MHWEPNQQTNQRENVQPIPIHNTQQPKQPNGRCLCVCVFSRIGSSLLFALPKTSLHTVTSLSAGQRAMIPLGTWLEWPIYFPRRFACSTTTRVGRASWYKDSGFFYYQFRFSRHNPGKCYFSTLSLSMSKPPSTTNTRRENLLTHLCLESSSSFASHK